MALHESDEELTVYFVLKTDGDQTIIQGWSEDKKLVDSYMEFHSCKKFKIKKSTKDSHSMYKILEENLHDEIKLFYITTKDMKHEGEVKSIAIPATDTEINLLNDETNTLAASMIRYSYINDAVPYLKPKYRKMLKNVGLIDFMDKAIHERTSKFIQSIEFDQLILLYKLYADNFD